MSPEKVKDVLAISNIFLLNHEEAYQFTGIKDIPMSANQLHAAGPDIVVIKMGADGAYLSFEDEAFYIPVFPVEKVVDPTGAGDSFAGGFMGCLANMDEPDFVEGRLSIRYLEEHPELLNEAPVDPEVIRSIAIAGALLEAKENQRTRLSRTTPTMSRWQSEGILREPPRG